jgi:hypothetical protein
METMKAIDQDAVVNIIAKEGEFVCGRLKRQVLGLTE